MAPAGIVLSGGSSSCYDPGAPTVSPELFSLRVPVLGICYGAQLAARLLGGKVEPAAKREYGRAHVTVRRAEGVLAGFALGEELSVWMSHGDRVETLPPGFELIGDSANSPAAAFADAARRIYAVQFHPEVAHTPRGHEILRNFVSRCECKGEWSMSSFVDGRSRRSTRASATQGGSCAGCRAGRLVGGRGAAPPRDGDRLTCISSTTVCCGPASAKRRGGVSRSLKIDLRVIDARAILSRAGGRHRPGRSARSSASSSSGFQEVARGIGDVRFLAQGALYPDVIESVSFRVRRRR
jgi:GMP synthase (glutamine-hydrolysing)